MQRPMWLGVLIAPLAAPLLYFIGFLVFIRPPIGSLKELLIGFGIVFVFATPVSYLATIALGIPLVLVLRATDRLSFWWCTLGAIPLGILSFLGFFVAIWGLAVITQIAQRDLVAFITAGGALGFGVASTFCLVTGIKSREPAALTGPS